jgi:hypothetical protein
VHRRRGRRLRRAQHVVRRRHRRGDDAHREAPDPVRPRRRRRGAGLRPGALRPSRS